MKIDTHQHHWRYEPQAFSWIEDDMPCLQQDHLPPDVDTAMQTAGVDAVVAVQARTSLDDTDFLLAVADAHPRVLGVVGWADLAAHDLHAHLERWTAHPAMCGIRHPLQDEANLGAWLQDTRHADGLRWVQRAGLAYDVLVFDHQLNEVLPLCAAHDAHWLVLDHLGKPAIRHWRSQPSVADAWRRNIRRLAALPHVVCKLSGLVTETDWRLGDGLAAEHLATIGSCFDHALEAFGPKRLMFGSDWPVCQLAAPYDVVHGLVQTWASTRLSQTEQVAFWSGNAIQCYGLRMAAKE